MILDLNEFSGEYAGVLANILSLHSFMTFSFEFIVIILCCSSTLEVDLELCLLGTVVIEGDTRSGAITTANHAIEQGRDVFVIPGNPTLEHYKGSNNLLRDGAIPLLDASDVFNVYIPKFSEKLDLERAFQPIKKKKVEKTQEKVIKIEKIYVEGLSKEAEIVI